uniref:Uncharacterized protein n=1 Tax=Pogona vitticeps TaxID=103695 RepID=A0ABM5EW67_9SAUR
MLKTERSSKAQKPTDTIDPNSTCKEFKLQLMWHYFTALLFLFVTADCTHVADFDNCLGDVRDFCPRGIACGCKDQKPFCKCPSYRSLWQDYWYMGPKCDHLWSSLDLILIVALPAVTLSCVVAVTMQWINYCKSTPGRGARQKSPSGRGQRRGYDPDSAGKARPVSQPKGGKADEGAAQNYKFPKLPQKKQQYKPPALPRFEGFSYIAHQPLRRANPADDVFTNPSPRVGYWDDNLPAADYEEENPFAAIPMEQFPKPGSPFFPRPPYSEPFGDAAAPYQQRSGQPANDPNAARGPYRIGRPQNVYT